MVGLPSAVLSLRELQSISHGQSLVCRVLVSLWWLCLNLIVVVNSLGFLITSFVAFIRGPNFRSGWSLTRFVVHEFISGGVGGGWALVLLASCGETILGSAVVDVPCLAGRGRSCLPCLLSLLRGRPRSRLNLLPRVHDRWLQGLMVSVDKTDWKKMYY